MSAEDLPTRWVRKDGVKAIVIAYGGGSRPTVDLKLATGRIATMTVERLRKNYDAVPEDGDRT